MADVKEGKKKQKSRFAVEFRDTNFVLVRVSLSHPRYTGNSMDNQRHGIILLPKYL